MKKNTLLVVLIIVALATTAFAKIGDGKLGILMPTKPGTESEILPIDKKELKALRAGETTVGELMLHLLDLPENLPLYHGGAMLAVYNINDNAHLSIEEIEEELC